LRKETGQAKAPHRGKKVGGKKEIKRGRIGSAGGMYFASESSRSKVAQVPGRGTRELKRTRRNFKFNKRSQKEWADPAVGAELRHKG